MENTTAKQAGGRVAGIGPRMEAVYCPICTHTVPAEVVWRGKRFVVKPGQKCTRCHSQLDAGYIMRTDQAA
ncbi:MAG TPA: hypothetical protein VHZ07_07505 [Bryobacteraceae bacterium]|nr:hypothetical protein [Bryobacteraceae bacterium]